MTDLGIVGVLNRVPQHKETQKGRNRTINLDIRGLYRQRLMEEMAAAAQLPSPKCNR